MNGNKLKSDFTRIRAAILCGHQLNLMAKSFSILGVVVGLAVLATGCAGPEKKLGRGFNNLYEPIRLAEMRRSIEQGALATPGDINYHTGVIRGLNRTLARTGIGIWEIVTIFTDYLKPNPAYPDSYKPALFEDSVFATDTSIRFDGGDVAPFIPGSRFHVFD
jgi:putative exosortase-associated protein (TIGR04073 family)